VLLPKFSRQIAAAEWTSLERLFRTCLAWVFAASVPGVILLAVFSEPIVRLCFQRGAFTAETTVDVSAVQFWTLPQIPFYVATMIGSRSRATSVSSSSSKDRRQC
jgi:putative peptidoglycan lipid II flippase